MKKIFIVLLCAILMCAMTVVAFADEEISAPVETNAVETETLAPETESVTEGENTATEDTPIVTTEAIKAWVESHLEEISVVITLIFSTILQIRKHAVVGKSVATCNNNAVAISENSNAAIQVALTEVKKVNDEINSLLAEIRKSEAEKKKLEAALIEVENYLKTAKLANLELSNEVAELLVLANIPNSKKEELYSRHRKAVDALAEVEMSANHTEVKENDGEEA